MRKKYLRAPTLVVLSVALSLVTPGLLAPHAAAVTRQPNVSAAPVHPSLRFEENRGQTDAQVRYVAHASRATIFFTPREIVFSLSKAATGDVVRLRPVAANPSPRVTASGRQAGASNYLIGRDRTRWVRGVPSFSRVRYHDLWPGVDVVFYQGHGGGLEYDIVAAPHAKTNVAFAVAGARTLSLHRGALKIVTAAGTLTHAAPRAYERGSHKHVAASTVLDGSTFSFRVGRHDTSKTLVIDPEVLGYSTFLGGTDSDQGNGIAVDGSGAAYVTGFAMSTDFPTTAGAFQTTLAGAGDAFVTKLSPDGSSLDYSTYLGGSASDFTFRIAVDGNGDAYVVGVTGSLNFPTTPGAFQTASSGADDGFVTKLNPTGTALVYSTYLGGSGADNAEGIAVDGTGAAFVIGASQSTNFPTTVGAFQTTLAGSSDAFVTKLNPTGTALVYSTYLGGVSSDAGAGVSIDANGAAYLTGSTGSSNFPTTVGAFQTTLAGSSDAFVTKLNPTGTALVYSTYLGGTSADGGTDIPVDANGNVYMGGYTNSTDYPVTPGAFQTTASGNTDGVVTKLSSDGTSLVYSTYLGGAGFEFGRGLALGPSGTATLVGLTTSTDFPVCTATGTPAGCTGPAFQTSNGGSEDAFVTALSADGSKLAYSTYLGGSGLDQGNDVAVDGNGGTYVTGYSDTSDYPVCTGAGTPAGCSGPAFQTSNIGTGDAIITKLVRSNPPPDTFIRHVSIKGHTATFAFASSEPNSTFVCALDRGRYKPCSSPKTYRKLPAGSHVFRVKARNAAGVLDPTPAKRRFTISPTPSPCSGVCT